MTERERTGYLGVMATALAKVPAADPWAAPRLAPHSRRRPDSFLLGRDLAHVVVTVPAALEAGQRYPLVIDLRGIAALAGLGDAHAPAADADDDGAFVVTPRRGTWPSARLTAAITRFMVAKYAADGDRVTVRLDEPALAGRKAKPKTAASR
jgi:hypothetical protein